MPSKTAKQAKAMRAACHSKQRKGGIPKKVACEFAAADKRTGKFRKKKSAKKGKR
jgi:hypothetical protein